MVGYGVCFNSVLELVLGKVGIEVKSIVIVIVSLYSDLEDNGFKIGVVLEGIIEG